MDVVARGADVTIVSFAGMAVQYAGLPTFEFRRQLEAHGDQFNLVFFRDVWRTCYHRCPQRTKNGLHFYEHELRRILDELGSNYNVMLGASGGGGAALYYGLRCSANQIIAFNPGYEFVHFLRPRTMARTFLDPRPLLTDPRAYGELLVVGLAGIAANAYFRSVYKPHERWNVSALMEQAKLPPTTVYYGERCPFDADLAARLRQHEGLKLVGLPTARHNCASVLKKQGRLGKTILAEIHAARARAAEHVA